MHRTERLLADGKRTLIERLRFRLVADLVVEQREIVEREDNNG